MCVSGCVTKSDRSLNIIVLSELSLTRSLPYWTGKVQGKWIWFLTHSTSSSQPQDPQQKKRELSIIQTGFLVSQTLLLKHLHQHLTIYSSSHAVRYGKCGPHVCTCSAEITPQGGTWSWNLPIRFIQIHTSKISLLIHASTPPSEPTSFSSLLCCIFVRKAGLLTVFLRLSSPGVSFCRSLQIYWENKSSNSISTEREIERRTRKGDQRKKWRGKKKKKKEMDKKKINNSGRNQTSGKITL